MKHTDTPEKKPDPEQVLEFCVCCFASGENGSWNHIVVNGLCTNCGASASVSLPRWAIDNIRKNASWVGKRFYPSEEDHSETKERATLMSLIPADKFPGRTVEECPARPELSLPALWAVSQHTGDGRRSLTQYNTDEVSSPEEALEKARHLPFYAEPEELEKLKRTIAASFEEGSKLEEIAKELLYVDITDSGDMLSAINNVRELVGQKPLSMDDE